MKNASIQIKAAFLLLVFTMNTVVGFACSMGLDMGFNFKHSAVVKGKEATVHVHADGKIHDHQKKSSTNGHDNATDKATSLQSSSYHLHKNGKKHIHENKSNDQSGNDHKLNPEKENCCNDKVIEFERLDKSLAQSLIIAHPVFFTAFVASFHIVNESFLSRGAPNIKYFVRSHHPPIPDIRIAIQSFQV